MKRPAETEADLNAVAVSASVVALRCLVAAAMLIGAALSRGRLW